MPRSVRIVLCDPTGTVIGELPEIVVEPQWWPEVAPVAAVVRERFGADITVLRLLETDGPSAEMGGSVTYLAELSGEMPAAASPTAYDLDLADEPLRAPWARPGGVAVTVAWADAVLAGLARPRTGPVVHQKSWNLSSILRLPTAAGEVWCKAVPPFFAHEGAVLTMIAERDPGLVPAVLGCDRAIATVLVDDVPGEDQWQAPVDRLVEMVRQLVRLQSAWAPRTADLLAAGVWDWRALGFAARVDDLVRRPGIRAQLSAEELVRLDALAADLPARLEELTSCGLPDTLTHGDFHPGNWRFGPKGLVLLDWGDAGVGHPMLDFAAFLPRIVPEAKLAVRSAWVDAWLKARPRSDPARAATLIDPVAALRQAILYQCFLDRIESSERVYHVDDPATWLRRALSAAAQTSP